MTTRQAPQRRETDDQQAERVRDLERGRLSRKVVCEMRKTRMLLTPAELALANIRQARRKR